MASPLRDRLREAPVDATAAPAPAPAVPPRLQRSLRALAHELTVAEARERERIARALHDDIGQILAVARFRLGELQRGADAAQRAALDEVVALVAQAAAATRGATFDLANPALSLGLGEALHELARRLTQPGGPRFRVDDQLPALAWSAPVLPVLYRVLRELATNALRHARARQVCMAVDVEDGTTLVLSVEDDGIGVDPARLARGATREGGYGLPSALAQMQALGGTLVVESGRGSGTRATARLALALAVAGRA